MADELDESICGGCGPRPEDLVEELTYIGNLLRHPGPEYDVRDLCRKAADHIVLLEDLLNVWRLGAGVSPSDSSGRTDNHPLDEKVRWECRCSELPEIPLPSTDSKET